VAAILTIAALWLRQNIQIQNEVIDGNMQNYTIIRNQEKIQKTLDERTPMLNAMKKKIDRLDKEVHKLKSGGG
jgi:archaellum component FlaC